MSGTSYHEWGQIAVAGLIWGKSAVFRRISTKQKTINKTTSAIKQKKQLPKQLNVATSCCDTLRTLGGRLACQGGGKVGGLIWIWKFWKSNYIIISPLKGTARFRTTLGTPPPTTPHTQTLHWRRSTRTHITDKNKERRTQLYHFSITMHHYCTTISLLSKLTFSLSLLYII